MNPKLTFVHAIEPPLALDAAFQYMLGLSAACNAHLTTLVANPELSCHSERPDVEGLTEGWAKPFTDYGFVRHACCEDPVDTLLDALPGLHPQIVMVSYQELGIFQRSTPMSLALSTSVPLLFIPLAHPESFGVSPDGRVKLRNVLIPVDSVDALSVANKALEPLRQGFDLRLTALHVGPDSDRSQAIARAAEQCGVAFVRRDGELEDALEETVKWRDVDMIAMATAGHNSLLDFFRGSRTENAIKAAAVPLLSVPLPA